jgi:hypothetical protein
MARTVRRLAAGSKGPTLPGVNARGFREPPRRGVFLAVALALHAAVFLLIARTPVHVFEAPREAPEIRLEVTLEPPPSEPAEVHAEESAEPRPAQAGARAERGAIAVTRPAPAIATDPRDSAGRAPEDAPPPVTFTTPPDLGVGGKNPFLPRSAAGIAEHEQKKNVDRALRDPARDRERELGLGPEGPVLTALASATSESLAPVKGRAVFVATANADGEVVGLELADTEGDRPGWADARRIALEALRGKKLRLPGGTSGARMRIEVVSTWKLPSGHDPGTAVTLFHVPVTRGEGKQSTKVEILDPIPKLRVDQLEIAPGVKVPVVSLGLNLFSLHGDPANIGANPRRVIHSRLLDSQVM